MFARELRKDAHTRRFLIQEKGTEGWEVRVEEDNAVLRRICYTDWHRVERAMAGFSRQIDALEETGWRE